MPDTNRTGRINLKLLLILGLGFCVVGAGIIVGHAIQKRMIADRALKTGQAAFAAKDWDTAGRELRVYLSKYPNENEVLLQYAQAELSIRPARPEAIAAAIWAYRRTLRSRPGDADLCERLCRLYFAMGDYVETRYIAGQRLSVAPDDASAMIWVSRALLAQHKIPDLEDGMKGKDGSAGFLDNQPQSIPLYTLLSEGYLVSGEKEKALKVLDTAVLKNPKSAEALAERARYYLLPQTSPDTDRRKKGRSDLETADALKPTDPKVRMLLADQWLQLEDYDRAKAEVEALDALPPPAHDVFEFEREEARLAELQLAAKVALLSDDVAKTIPLAQAGLKDLTLSRRVQFLPVAAQLFMMGDQKDQARECLKEYHQAIDDAARSNKQLTEELALLDAQLNNAESQPYTALSRLQDVASQGNPDNVVVYREEGYAYIRTNQDRLAADALEKYLSIRHNDFKALFELARLYARNNDWAGVLKYTQVALEIKRDDLSTRLLQIQSILLGGRGTEPGQPEKERIVGELQALRKDHPKSVEVRLLQAMLLLQAKNIDGCEKELRQAMAECEDPVSATMQLARLLSTQQKYDEAIVLCRQAIQQDPRLAQPRIMLADLLAGTKHKDEARQTLEEAQSALKGQEAATARTALAGYLLANNERDKGLTMLREMAKNDKNNLNVRTQLLDQPEVQNNETEAQGLVDEIRHIEGEHGIRWRYEQARLYMGDRYDKNWKPYEDQVVEKLKEAVEGDQAWTAAVVRLGIAYETIGKDQQADEIYRRFIENHPNNIPVIAHYLDFLEQHGQYAHASQILDRVPALSDKPDPLLKYRIRIAVSQHRYDDAIKELNKQIERNPQDAESRVTLARLTYQQTKDLDKSLTMLDEAQKVSPDLISIAVARATLLTSAGKNDEAMKILDAEVQRRNNFDAYLMRADYYSSQEKQAQAEKDYQHLTTFAGSAAEGYLRLGVFYERTQRNDDAIAAYAAGLKADAKSLALRRAYARTLLKSSNPEFQKKGNELLEQLLKDHEQDPSIVIIQAENLFNQGTLDARQKSMELFEKVVQLDPQNTQAHLQLIAFATAQGDVPKAMQLATRAIGANPDSPDLLLVLAALESDQQNYNAARGHVQTAIDRDPNNIAAINLLTQIALRLGDLKAAEQENNAALKQSPNQVEATLFQAHIAVAKNQLAEGTRLLEEFRKTPNGKYFKVALTLADFYRMQKKYDQCEQLLQEAEKAAPELFNIFAVRLQSYAEQGKFDELFKLLNARLTLRPNEAIALTSVAAVLADTNDLSQLERAKPIFQKFVKNNPKNVDGFISLGMVNYRLQDMVNAQASYQAALDLDGYHLKALNNLAWLKSEELGKYDEALDLANKGVLRYPADPNLLNTRGIILFHLSKLTESKLDLQKCLELTNVEPGTRARTLSYLARIAQRDGDPDQARTLFAQALQIDDKSKVLTPHEREEIEKIAGPISTKPAIN